MKTNPTDNQTPSEFISDPDNIKKAVEGSMDKRQAILDNQTPQPVDELDEILGWVQWVASRNEGLLSEHRREAKARLLQWGTRQRLKELEKRHTQLEVVKSNIVRWSNEHEALGIGWVITSTDKMAYDAKEELKQLQASLKDGGTK